MGWGGEVITTTTTDAGVGIGIGMGWGGVGEKVEGFPVSQIFFLGVIFQNGFSPKALQPEAPGVWGDPRSNLEVFCHEATFQECQKSRKLNSTIQ